MTPAGFEPAIPACERPQTHALGRDVTGIGNNSSYYEIEKMNKCDHNVLNDLTLLQSFI